MESENLENEFRRLAGADKTIVFVVGVQDYERGGTEQTLKHYQFGFHSNFTFLQESSQCCICLKIILAHFARIGNDILIKEEINQAISCFN